MLLGGHDNTTSTAADGSGVVAPRWLKTDTLMLLLALIYDLLSGSERARIDGAALVFAKHNAS